MRIKIVFRNSDLKISKRKILSFVKKVFHTHSEALYSELFRKKAFKPYVFSIYWGKNFPQEVGPISLIFSTGDFQIFTAFWNGLLALKQKNEPFFLLPDKIQLLPPKTIKSNKIFFQTLGAAVLTNPFVDPKKFKEWYLVPTSENVIYFNKILNLRLSQRYQFITGKPLLSEIKFTPLLVRETILPGIEKNVRAWKGKFLLEGPPEVLQFIYDYGIGVKTGQGWGLVDVVQQ